MTDVSPETPAQHAQAFAQKYVGLRIQDQTESVGRTVTYDDLVQAFADAAESAVDRYIHDQHGKAAAINASIGSSEHPEERPRDERRSAQSMLVAYLGGEEFMMHTHHPMLTEGGWTLRMINSVPFLVIGHGIPRKMIPLCNIKYIDLTDELL